MNPDENETKPQPEGLPSKDEKPEEQRLEAAERPDLDENTETKALKADDTPPAAMEKAPEEAKAAEREPTAESEPLPRAADESQIAAPASSAAPLAVRRETPRRFFAEQVPDVVEQAPQSLRRRTRRDFLFFGAGAIATLAGGGLLLPRDTLARLGVHRNLESPGKEWLLNRALRIDDDVAAALYSTDRLVPTYTKSQITPLRNNYNGATPDPGYIPGWKLTLDGLASGLSVSLDLRTLLTRFSPQEQITRLVCVEGWSAIAWWSGLRFDDLLRAYPPMSQARWARLESAVNLDSIGNPDPYFVSIDLPTARHQQTLLATHFNGQPLTVEHGAPLRLLAPVKLGLKNVKAITSITYTAEEPGIIGLNAGTRTTTASSQHSVVAEAGGPLQD